MISYFGLPLIDVTPQIDGWATSLIDPSWSARELSRTGPGYGAEFLDTGRSVPAGPARLGVLEWPCWGAQRWAEGLYVCDRPTLLELRRLAYPSGAPAAGTLRLDDGSSAVECSMYMLPARPLAQADPAAGSLYLLTLVDRRYFWWYTSSALSVTGGSTTWAQLYAALAAELGVTLTADAVNAYYLLPPASFGGLRRPVPVLLDSAAAAVGHRVCFPLSGGAYAYSADTSLSLHAQNLRLYASRLAGGTLSLLEPDGADLPAELPASVTVSFGRIGGSEPPYEVEWTLAGLKADPATGLGLLYGATPGFAGTKCLRSGALAGSAATPDNSAELQSLSERAAIDWYKHRAGRADVRLAGFVPWEAEGLTWSLEYEHRLGRLSTRASRKPSVDHAEDLPHRSSAHPAPVSDPTTFTSTTVTVDGTNVSVTNNSTVTIDGGSDVTYDGASTVTYESSTVTYDTGSSVVWSGGSSTFDTNTTWTVNSGVTTTVNGPGYWVINAGFTVCGWLSYCTGTVSITSDQNNYSPPDATFLLITTDAERKITGFAVTNGPGGTPVSRHFIVANVGSNPLVFTHQDTNSSAASRIILPGALPVTLSAGDNALFSYDTTAQRWRLLSGTADIPRQQSVTVSTSQNNYALDESGSSLLVNCTAASSITGFANGYDGRLLVVTNTGAETLTLERLDGASSGSNQMDFSAGADIALSAGQSVALVYDGADDVWRDISPKSGSTGGGSSPTSDNGTTTLGGPYNTTTTLADTGLTFAIPATGTYLITGQIEFVIQANTAQTTASYRLTNFTSGVNRETYLALSTIGATDPVRCVAPISDVITANAGDSIRVQARHTTMGVVSTGQVTQGRLNYVRLS